ncbi:MAG TPA: nuclear transport factor 2 family protein [Gemmatimonadaceae bacterium]|nr:nuclear transport factor 2 family protein [Gemmatimonadaceae bacterium]
MFFAILLLFSSPHGAACPADEAKDEAALVRVEQAWVRAAEHHDTTALECLLATEFEEADFDGSLITRSAMLANAAKPSSSHSELVDLHVHIYGEAAYVRGIGVNSENGRPTGRTRFTDVFVFRDGRWQCVAGHDSRFPKGR